jgi:exopolyphosphatase / guanosine-5'-triphosphate,3'-diphosphate pyrophosphatase
MLAALDLGSNSFHMLIAEKTGNSYRVVERFSEKVQLGEGVATTGKVCEIARARAVVCLADFREAINRYPVTAIAAIGTKTFRTASNIGPLLRDAEELGFLIDIVSGEREAQLIYSGVANALPDDNQKRLVIDIGGGSTELAIGLDRTPLLLRSLDLGCVSWRDRFFSSGTVDEEDFREAMIAAREHIYLNRRELNAVGWKNVYASSGTAKMLCNIAKEQKYTDGTLTMEALKKIRNDALAFPRIHQIELPGLKSTRQNVLLPGLAIMIAIMKELQIASIRYSKAALREGVLLELLNGGGQQIRLM